MHVAFCDWNALKTAIDSVDKVSLEEDLWDKVDDLLFHACSCDRETEKNALTRCMQKYTLPDDTCSFLTLIRDKVTTDDSGFCLVGPSQDLLSKEFWVKFRSIIFSTARDRLKRVCTLLENCEPEKLQGSFHRFLIYTIVLHALKLLENENPANIPAVSGICKGFFKNEIKGSEVHLWLDILLQLNVSESVCASFIQILGKKVLEEVIETPYPFQDKLLEFYRAILSKLTDDDKIAFFQKALPKLLVKDTLLAEIVCEQMARDHRVKKRYEQLKQAESLTISTEGRLRIAIFIEKTYGSCEYPYVKKNVESLPLSLIKGQKAWYALYKTKIAILDASGTYKRVTAALSLPKEVSERTFVVAQEVSKWKIGVHSFAALQHEVEILRELEDVPGLIRVLDDCEYCKSKDGVVIRIKCAMVPLYDGSIDKILNDLTPKQMVSIARQLAQIIAHLHRKGYIHGDLKLQNILYRRTGDDIEIALCDCGFTFNMAKQSARNVFQTGTYGSIPYTTPEVLGVISPQGGYKEAEIWAFGMVLYLMCTKQEFPPYKDALQRFNETKSILSLETLLKPVMDAYLTYFASLHITDPFLACIISMLSKNPAERPNAEACLAKLAEIEKIY